jgi:hypothetical protein
LRSVDGLVDVFLSYAHILDHRYKRFALPPSYIAPSFPSMSKPSSLPPPSPERDRAVANQPRYGRRNAVHVGDIIDSIMSSEDIKRMRRFQRISRTLKECLDEKSLKKVKPQQIKLGVLTLEVADTMLLAELRQHHGPRLLAALVASGTGISKLAWRLRRS